MRTFCSYPFSALSLYSDPAYGSYKSLHANAGGCASLTYTSDYGNAYVLIPPGKGTDIPADAKTSVEVTCTLTGCMRNQYLSNGACIQCPGDTWSNVGSISAQSCNKCPPGTFLAHPRASDCALSVEYKTIWSSKGWRVWSNGFHLDYWGKWWKLEQVEFYGDVACTETIDTSNGAAIDSAHYGNSASWDADNAFGGGVWLGWPDSDGLTWVGMKFPAEVQVQCLKVFAGDNFKSTELRVQAYNEAEDTWENAWIEKTLDQTDNAIHTIPLFYGAVPSLQPSVSMIPTETPSVEPSETPSVSMIPTETPSDEPSETPSVSMIPTVSPSDEPSETPSNVPSLSPSSQPSLSAAPSKAPSGAPSSQPSLSAAPSKAPSGAPSSQPSLSVFPSKAPSGAPSSIPSGAPSSKPSLSAAPSDVPSTVPSTAPSQLPSLSPSLSMVPSENPTAIPTKRTRNPANIPTPSPSSKPSAMASSPPTDRPSDDTRAPSHSPSSFPSSSSPTVKKYASKTTTSIAFGNTCEYKAAMENAILASLRAIFPFANIAMIGFTQKCTSRNGRALGDSIEFLTEIIQESTDPSTILSAEDVVQGLEDNSGTIAATVSEETGLDLVVTEISKIEEPSAAPTLSPSPTLSQGPTLSQKPTNLQHPSSAPTGFPTTEVSRTFNIISSYKFDDSKRSFCLQAMNTRVGSVLKMRPCDKNRYNTQAWFLDEYDQLRLRDKPELCARWNGKGKKLKMGECHNNGITKEFLFDTEKGTLSVRKKNTTLFVAVNPKKKYGYVRLFVKKESNALWSLNFLGNP